MAKRLVIESIWWPPILLGVAVGASVALEVWPESHWPGFALREVDVFKTYMAWWCI